MKVSEIIAELQKHDPDSVVVGPMHDYTNSYSRVGPVQNKQMVMIKSPYDTRYLDQSDDLSDNAKLVDVVTI